ncbi:PucR family transcriptional regulator [Nocardioides caldifontis]|uniref:PucR family transcriptional regulator n=1 Tax=Nocardioides caldifontis TaxID=2588938 RepID=UPI0011DF5CEF|nr:helix-turn-helix domain-containing protein [Nocardioides caldifontis]
MHVLEPSPAPMAGHLVQAELVPELVDPAEKALCGEIAGVLTIRNGDITDSLLDWLLQVFPELPDDQTEHTALRASITDNLRTMWQMVAGGLVPSVVEPPPSALVWPRKMVHQRVPVSVLTRIYYVGHAMIWHRWVQPAVALHAGEGVDVAKVGAWLHAATFNYLDRAAQRVAEHYEAEAAELFGSRVRSRTAAALEVVHGKPVTAATRRALDFALHDPHRAWVLWAPESPLDLRTELLRTAEDVHAVLGHGDRLALSHGPSEVWGWTSRPVELSPELRGRLLRVLRQPALPRLHLAVSAPAVHETGFRDGILDARRLQSAVVSAGLPAPTVHTQEEAGLAALLLADPAGARRFIATRLRGLAADTSAARTLRETLRVFLAESGSHSRAAAALRVHRNTVAYRLRRVEAELGRPLQLPEHELSSALLIDAWL